MNVNDQAFFDLAMKAIAKQSSEAEQAELETLLARQPELRAEFDRLQAQARLVKDVLPLLTVTEATAGEVPAYARERLRTKVREAQRKGAEQELKGGSDQEPSRWRWQWLFGLATATAVVVGAVLLSSLLRPQQPFIQLAMMDAVGATRGSDTNVLPVLQRTWHETNVLAFSTPGELKIWLGEWPAESRQPTVKILYDRDAEEIRVLGRCKGKPLFERTFSVRTREDLLTAVEQAKQFVAEQLSK